MKVFQLSTSVLALILALWSCNSSNFAGSQKKSGGKGSDANSQGGDANGGDLDQSNGEDGGAGGGDFDGADGACAPPTAMQLQTAGAAEKTILFYAPASYSPVGGTEGTTNEFLNEVLPAFQANGWKVTVITKVGENGVTFDECNLVRSFKQVWLWLPCNNLQNMDDKSLAGVKSYYDFGGGLVVLPDNHYFVPGNPNTHCDPASYKGAAAFPSDATRISQYMGFALESGALAAGTAVLNTTHPLAKTLQPLLYDVHWQQNRINNGPANAIWLPVNNMPNFSAMIDETTAPVAAGKFPKLGLILTPVYKYHSAPDDDDIVALNAIATYFDVQIKAIAAKNGGTTLTAPSAARFDPGQFRSRAAPLSPTGLREMLATNEKDNVSRALRMLAQLNAISLDELMSYHDDSRWLVRFAAAMAAGTLPKADVVPNLMAKLNARPLSPDMAIFVSRALSRHRAFQALPGLEAAAVDFVNEPYWHEHNVRAELEAVIKDMKALAAPRP